VLLGDTTAVDVLWIALSVFFVVLALGLGYLCFRLAGAVGRLSGFIRGLEQEVLPVINKIGGTVDRTNQQLDKVDLVTDSAVDAAESVDTVIRAVTMAVTRPVQRISGLAAGITHGFASLWARRDPSAAYEDAKRAAERREREIAEELAREEPVP
jgi:signal transduction histidine kinase